MASALDNFVNTAGRVAAGAAKQAERLVNKGYDKATQLALQRKINKLYKHLGALVYALRKNQDENEPMMAWYEAEIDKLKQRLAELNEMEEDDIILLDEEKAAAPEMVTADIIDEENEEAPGENAMFPGSAEHELSQEQDENLDKTTF